MRRIKNVVRLGFNQMIETGLLKNYIVEMLLLELEMIKKTRPFLEYKLSLLPLGLLFSEHIPL